MSDWSRQLGETLPTGSGDGAWPAALRQAGAQAFGAHGVPDTRVEQWKYTSLRSLEQRAPGLAESPGQPQRPAPDAVVDTPLRARLHDGDLAAASGEIPAGLRIQSLGAALEDDVPGLRKLLESLELVQRWQGMAALNTAALGAGLVLRVDDGVDAGQVLLQWTGCADAERLYNSRVCVLLGEGARLGLVEQFDDGKGSASTLNGVWQCSLGRDARLDHARVQRLGAESTLLGLTEARQAAGSRYHFSSLDLGGGLVRHDIRALLAEQGARCDLDAVSVVGGRSHVDHHFEAAHLAGNCESAQTYRAVAAERGRAVFNGRVHIVPGADGSESNQSSAGLLMSPLAEIDSKPELEIYADEVVASHGATVGQLDEQALFYLQSRGLDSNAARNLLTMAFGRVVTDRLPVEAWRDALGAALQQRMEHLDSTDA